MRNLESDYLKKHKQQAEKLFEQKEKALYEEEEEEEDCKSRVRYIKTVLTTWNITRNRIGDNTAHGKQAIDILDVMAYLAPDDINIEEIFAKSIADNEQRLWDILKLLDRYSMINLSEKIVNIHRLVEKVRKLKSRESGQEEAILRKALKLINNDDITKENVSHVASILGYASRHGMLIDDFYSNSTYTNYGSTSLTYLLRVVIAQQLKPY